MLPGTVVNPTYIFLDNCLFVSVLQSHLYIMSFLGLTLYFKTVAAEDVKTVAALPRKAATYGQCLKCL